MDKYVDISGFHLKTKAVTGVVAKRIPDVIQHAAQSLHDQVDKNLSGGTYRPGKLPVRRKTGTLARALYLKMLDPMIYAVGVDGKIVPYWIYVHYGTKHMKARRFFEDALAKMRAPLLKRMKKEIKEIIQEAGI